MNIQTLYRRYVFMRPFASPRLLTARESKRRQRERLDAFWKVKDAGCEFSQSYPEESLCGLSRARFVNAKMNFRT